ncbi:MAG TPA: adenylyl-sulfate kinase [Gemmatimonadetes bacterium]|nr:adenylyl-sulfate kinase [Gemmatimonadota bacterium]
MQRRARFVAVRRGRELDELRVAVLGPPAAVVGDGAHRRTGQRPQERPGAHTDAVVGLVEQRLFSDGCQTMLLVGDQVRHGLNGDLAFTPEDRTENIRRVGEVALLFFLQGNIVICTFVSPFQEDRQRVRDLLPAGRFVEVFVDTPLEECERRDPKGLYARARKGEIAHMTGISSPYEAPQDAEIRVETIGKGLEECVEEVIGALRELGRGEEPQ